MGALTPGRTIAGKYSLEAQIGLGGMGEVWRARHLQLDMLVAIKFMDGHAAASPEARLRFEREAKAAAKLRSPHVVQVLDHGQDAGSHYIVMELLEGDDLSVHLRKVGRLSLDEAERVLTHAAKGLRRAHEAGIVHRDLKPSNIFLAQVDDEIVAKVLDFGVAKLKGQVGDIAQSEATQVGTVLGSPTYMSPEQVRGVRDLDHRTDLWSLGVIVFRMVTGQKPFEATSIGDLVVKLCVDPLPKATAVAPGLPASVDAFFDRAFARAMDQRFQTALEMAQAFRAVVADAKGLPAPNPLQDTFGGLSPEALASILSKAGDPKDSAGRALQAPPARPSGPTYTPLSGVSHRATDGALAVAEPRGREATPSQPLAPISGSGSFRIPAAMSLTPASGTVPTAEPFDATTMLAPHMGSLERSDSGSISVLAAASSAAEPAASSASGATPSPLAALPAGPPRRMSPVLLAISVGAGLGLFGLVVLVLVAGSGSDPQKPKRSARTPDAVSVEPSATPVSPPAPPAPASAPEAPPTASAIEPAGSGSAPLEAPAPPKQEGTPAPSGSAKKPPKKRPKFGY